MFIIANAGPRVLALENVHMAGGHRCCQICGKLQTGPASTGPLSVNENTMKPEGFFFKGRATPCAMEPGPKHKTSMLHMYRAGLPIDDFTTGLRAGSPDAARNWKFPENAQREVYHC